MSVNVSLCDCGEPKSSSAECCDDCGWRDGRSTKETRIIDALRTAVSPVTVMQLAGLADMQQRSVLRSVKSLLRNGRVIKAEGPPSLYRLGETRRVGKSQSEIPGTERETIAELDEEILELIEAQQDIRHAKARVSEHMVRLQQIMLEKKSELDENDKGKPCYVFHDGELRLPFVLNTKHSIIQGKATRIEVEP